MTGPQLQGRHSFAALAAIVLAAPARLGGVRLVGVDGRAGSGKTTFAGRLSGALRDTGVTVAELHTDDFLDGWADLNAWWPRVRDWVLEPLRHGQSAAFRRYDWVAERLVDEWTPLAVPNILVLEGVGSARGELRADLSLGVLVRAGRELRLARGLARDGAALRPQWERWMVAEDVHFAADRTADAVDLVVDGAPTIEHNPRIEYIIAADG